MVLWFLPLLWPSTCKIHWHLLPFNSPWCPCSIFYSFSRQHWVPPLSYLGLGNPLPWSVPWTPGVFLGAAALNLTWVLVQNAGSQVPHLTHRIGTWWGGTVQTAVSMISQVILMHTELWETLLLMPATQRVAPGPEDLALPGSLRELWPLSPIPEVWVRICMSSGFPGGFYAHLSMRRTDQDPGFLPTLRTVIFLFPLQIPLPLHLKGSSSVILNTGCKWESLGEL